MTDTEVKFELRRIRGMLSHLPRLLYGEAAPLDAQVTTDPLPIPFGSLSTRSWRPISPGEVWGGKFESAWFRFTGKVPGAWSGEQVVARLQLGGEACVFDESGVPVLGLTNGSIFTQGFVRERVPLGDIGPGGREVNLLVEAAGNKLFGVERPGHPGVERPPEGQYRACFERAEVTVFNPVLFQFMTTTQELLGLMESLPDRDAHRAQLLHALSRAFDRFTPQTPNPAEALAELYPSLEQRGDTAQLRTRAVGHAHIDTAWLWPVRETVRKCARTFSNQLRLIEAHPDYVFGASQPQLYQFVKDHYPGLYEQIRAAVRAGRWECQGGMWVESDTNMPCGESLVRQLLYGKRFFSEEFGVDVRNLWLPDVFGYSAALPQLLRLAGIDAFLTQKLSWSQFNHFPHTTFRWRGIDGSEVLTHFPPEGNYNSNLSPASLRKASNNFEERGFIGEFLTLFGIGDGGGGPTERMLQTGRRFADFPSCPKIEFGPAQPMFDRLQEHWEQLPTWVGELYLELHRGTLTSQARTKRGNRRCELALRRVEMLAAAGALAHYPAEDLEALWKTVLLNQFHDIIPGSSITEVYQDAEADYERVLRRLEEIQADVVGQLASNSGPGAPPRAVTVFNPHSHALATAVNLGPVGESIVGVGNDDAAVPPTQIDENGHTWTQLDLNGFESRVLTIADSSSKAPTRGERLPPAVHATEHTLENELVRYEFDECGQLTRVLERETGRELLPPDRKGNVLALYQDWPHSWDAWEIDLTYEQQLLETATLVSTRVVAPEGPVFAEIQQNWTIGNSTITQRVRLAAKSARLDFQTHVDWQERRKMLRTSFPTTVVAEFATFEIQYGTLRRPTHRNTSWDRARFEVCAHRFADLSDLDGGLALLND